MQADMPPAPKTGPGDLKNPALSAKLLAADVCTRLFCMPIVLVLIILTLIIADGCLLAAFHLR